MQQRGLEGGREGGREGEERRKPNGRGEREKRPKNNATVLFMTKEGTKERVRNSTAAFRVRGSRTIKAALPTTTDEQRLASNELSTYSP